MYDISIARRRIVGLLAGALALVCAIPTLAAAPQVNTQAPGYCRAMIGAFEVTALCEGVMPLPVAQLLTGATPAGIRRLLRRDYLQEAVPSSVNAFLINTGTKLVLIDAGGGSLSGTALGHLLSNLHAAGHAPGPTSYIVSSQGQKLVVWGDLVHVAAVQFPQPSVTIKFDSDAKAAAAQRARAFRDAAREGYWVAGAHLPFPGLGHVRAEGQRYIWIPANYEIPR